MLRRINFAGSMANGKTPIARKPGIALAVLQPGQQPQAPDPQQMLQSLGPMFSPAALEQSVAAPRTGRPDPGFMKR